MNSNIESIESGDEVNNGREMSKELSDKIISLKSLVLVHNLLGECMFPFRASSAVKQGLDYIQSLYDVLKADILADPDCDLIPEIEQLRNGKPNEAE